MDLVKKNIIFAIPIRKEVISFRLDWAKLSNLEGRKDKIMARNCILTGKKTMTGNNVSHSNRKSKRRFYPNLQTKRYFDPETGEWITLKISTSAMRTINKLGFNEALNKFYKKGKI